MKYPEQDSEAKDWTYQEDLLLAQLIQQKDEIKWHKVAKKINKAFHSKQEIKKPNQVKRRWEKVMKPIQQQMWDRNDAQKFCTLSSQYVHSSRRFWNRLKKEFKGYSYKMLMHKLKQLKELNQAQFVLLHRNIIAKRQIVPSNPLDMLCMRLEMAQQN